MVWVVGWMSGRKQRNCHPHAAHDTSLRASWAMPSATSSSGGSLATGTADACAPELGRTDPGASGARAVEDMRVPASRDVRSLLIERGRSLPLPCPGRANDTKVGRDRSCTARNDGSSSGTLASQHHGQGHEHGTAAPELTTRLGASCGATISSSGGPSKPLM